MLSPFMGINPCHLTSTTTTPAAWKHFWWQLTVKTHFAVETKSVSSPPASSSCSRVLASPVDCNPTIMHCLKKWKRQTWTHFSCCSKQSSGKMYNKHHYLCESEAFGIWFQFKKMSLPSKYLIKNLLFSFNVLQFFAI